MTEMMKGVADVPVGLALISVLILLNAKQPRPTKKTYAYVP